MSAIAPDGDSAGVFHGESMDLIERVEAVLDATEMVSADEMIELIGCLGNVIGCTFQEGAPAVGGIAMMAFARELNEAMGAEVVH